MHTEDTPLLKGARYNSPKRIIIHAMSEYIKYEGEVLHAYAFLKKIGLSAHALVTPDGVIMKCRKDERGAYHAKGHNTDTLGVEFLVEGLHTYSEFLNAIDKKYLTDKQLYSGQKLVKGWMIKWNIDKKNVLLHSEVSPERKKDAGNGFVNSGFFNNI